VSPTLKDISDQDKEEFDVIEEQDTLTKLSDENDRVSGTERFYNYILHSKAAVATSLSQVSGSEGLLDMAKDGVKKVIQMVRDFFKWIWSFFSAKEKKIDHKLVSIDIHLKDKGVKPGEHEYPQSTFFIYPRPGKPVADLGWVAETNRRVSKGITNVGTYIKDLTDLLNSMERQAKAGGPIKVGDGIVEFYGKVRKIFGTSGRDKGTFITTDDFRFGPTKIQYHPSANTRKDFRGPKFTTTQTAVEGIRKDSKANLVQLKALTVDVQKLEKVMIDTLSVLSTSKEASAPVRKLFTSVVRNAMDDIRLFENVLYRALVTITDLCVVAIH